MNSSSPFWQTLLDETSKLQAELESYRSRVFNAESHLRYLERELKDARADVKKALIEKAFGKGQPSPK